MQAPHWSGRARSAVRGPAPAEAAGSSLPPAKVAVRFGSSPGARRVQRWIVAVWLIGMALGAGLGWLLWQLPEVLAIVLIVLVGSGALAATAGVALVLATMRRASVAAGDGWVGYRVLGRWQVVRPGGGPAAYGRFGTPGARSPYAEGAQPSTGGTDASQSAKSHAEGARSPSGPIELGPGDGPGTRR